jgi:hypothetical protein
MIMLTILAAALLGGAQIPPAAPSPERMADPAIARLATLYDRLCLRAFPDDVALNAAVAATGATPLTPEQVKVTFPNDPGRGWLLKDGELNIQIMLELPPYHACSVRRTASDGATNDDAYRAAVQSFKATHPGFAVGDALDQAMGELQIHLTSEQRLLPGNGGESLMVVEQRRQGGDGSVDLRYVHQIRAGTHR